MNLKIFLAILIALGIFFLGWFLIKKFPLLESEIVSRQGIHWHSQLTIKIMSEEQEIPSQIGMAGQEFPLHTHTSDGVIHMEFGGLVRKSDLKIGKFFQIWGKKFSKDCIFDKCQGSEGKVKMLVNNEENFEFENYQMKDNDKIEIIYE